LTREQPAIFGKYKQLMTRRSVASFGRTLIRHRSSLGSLHTSASAVFFVEDVEQPPRLGQATLVHAGCVDGDAQGEPISALWEYELDARVCKTPPEALAALAFGRKPCKVVKLATLEYQWQ
jgi:hypothetical protein